MAKVSRRSVLVAALAALLIPAAAALSACGDDGDSTATAPDPTELVGKTFVSESVSATEIPGGGPLEVLMLKRSAESHFMPSVWVFPGGSLDPEDGEGLDGLRTCAARELHEEAGIQIDLSTELIALARWVTPEVVKTRFDTWFFLARAPEGVEVKPDNFEMTEALWINPLDALTAAEAGDMAIVFPTLKQLEALAPSAHTDEAMERAAADPNASRAILPKVIGDEQNPRVVLPHEDDYPD